MSSLVTSKVDEDDEETTKMVQATISKIKSQGVFDQFRKDCLADVDTKPAAQNLRQRVEGFVGRFLGQQKWSPGLNKNQLRDSLRKQINQSGMLTQGVERIIEQVVNPKIFQVIKPKIDETVCSQLGINMKEWQAENARRKAELLRQQQAAQQAKIQAAIMEIQQKQLEKQEQQQLAELQHHQQAVVSSSASATGLPGFGIPPPSMFNAQDAMWQPVMNSFYPQPQFGNPFSFLGMGQQGFPPYMPGWGPVGAGLDLFQQQTVVPALSAAQPAQQTPTPIIPQSFTIASTPTPPTVPALPASIVQPPLPSAPPPGLPDLSKPPPTGEVVPPAPPSVSVVDMFVSTPSFSGGASNSGEMSPDPPPPGTEIALSSISLPSVLPKEESPAVLSHSFLSPRLLAEAMIESPQTVLSKKEAKRAARMLEEQNRRAGEPKAESTVIRSLFFESESSKVEPVEVEQEVTASELEQPPAVLSSSVVKDEEEKTEPEEATKDSKKQYTFAWDKKDEDEMSDITISSVHTSDLSSFIDGEESSEEGEISDKDEENKAPSKDLEDVSSATDSDVKASDISDHDVLEKTQPDQQLPVHTPEAKRRKLVALSYNYSDSDDDETREERKARLAKEKEERYLKRQARRAEMEVKRKEREEEKARQREEKKKAQACAEIVSDDGLPPKDKQFDQEENKEPESLALPSPRKTRSQTASSSAAATSSQDEGGASTPRAASTPRKKPRTKAEMKEELMQQKVEQRRAMRTRRRRTLNRRYASEEFTSIFSENRNLAPHIGFSDPNSEVVEQTVEVDTTVEIDSSGMFIQEVEVQEECVIETETIALPEESLSLGLDHSSGTVEIFEDDLHKGRDLKEEKMQQSSRISSPYSDISEESHSSRSSSSSSSSERRIPQRHRRRRNSSDSNHSDYVQVRRSARKQQISPEPIRTRRSSQGKGVPEVTESRSRTSQHYSTDDLYKPRTSHRRPLTPPAALEIRADRRTNSFSSSLRTRESRKSGDQHSQDRRSSSDQHMPDRRNSSDQHLQDRRINSDQHLQDRRSNSDQHIQDRRNSSDQHLQERRNNSDQHMQDRRITSDQHIQDRRNSSDQHMQDRRNSDQHIQDRRNNSDQHMQDRRNSSDQHMQDRRNSDQHIQDRRNNSDQRMQDRRNSGDQHSLDRRNSSDQNSQDRLSQKDGQTETKTYATRHDTSQMGTSTFSNHSNSPEHRPVTASVMADLELEPVSPDDDSLDNMMEEEEEESDKQEEDVHSFEKKGIKGSKDGQKTSSLSCRKSDSQEDSEEDERRRKSRVPIELVDFGEAARHARATAVGTAAVTSSASSWSSRRQEGRGYVVQPLPHLSSLPTPPPPPPLPQRPTTLPYSFERTKLTWPVKPPASLPPAESSQSSYPSYDRSKMIWIAPHLRNNRSSTGSFEGGSDLGGSLRPALSPRGSVAEDRRSSTGRDEQQDSTSRESSEERASPLPQLPPHPLYSPINDSSSSVLSGSSATPPPQSPLPPRRTKRRHSSSSSDSSSSSSSSSLKTPSPKPVKRKKKEGELSEGEVSSESSSHSVQERYRYENLPKSVRKYQVHSERDNSSNSLQASDISSSESVHSRRARTHSSVSQDSRGKRTISPPRQYSRMKRHRSTSLDSRKSKRRRTKSQHHHPESGFRRRAHRSPSPGEQRMRKTRSKRQRSSTSSESQAARFSPTRTPSPPVLGLAGSMSPISANSLLDSTEEGEAISPPPQLEEQFYASRRSAGEESWSPPRDPYSPLPERNSLSPPPLPDDLPPPPPSDDDSYPSPLPPRERRLMLSRPLPELDPTSGHALPVLPALQSGDLLSLPREALPPLPLDLMTSPLRELSPVHPDDSSSSSFQSLEQGNTSLQASLESESPPLSLVRKFQTQLEESASSSGSFTLQESEDRAVSSSLSEEPEPVPDELSTQTLPPSDELSTHSLPPSDELSTHTLPPSDELITHTLPPSDELSTHPLPPSDELSTHTLPPSDELGSHTLPLSDELSTHILPPSDELSTHTLPPSDELSSHTLPPSDELSTHTLPPSDELSSHTLPPSDELSTHTLPPSDELSTHILPPSDELSTHAQPPSDEISTHTLPRFGELNTRSLPISDELSTHTLAPSDELSIGTQPPSEESPFSSAFPSESVSSPQQHEETTAQSSAAKEHCQVSSAETSCKVPLTKEHVSSDPTPCSSHHSSGDPQQSPPLETLSVDHVSLAESVAPMLGSSTFLQTSQEFIPLPSPAADSEEYHDEKPALPSLPQRQVDQSSLEISPELVRTMAELPPQMDQKDQERESDPTESSSSGIVPDEMTNCSQQQQQSKSLLSPTNNVQHGLKETFATSELTVQSISLDSADQQLSTSGSGRMPPGLSLAQVSKEAESEMPFLQKVISERTTQALERKLPLLQAEVVSVEPVLQMASPLTPQALETPASLSSAQEISTTLSTYEITAPLTIHGKSTQETTALSPMKETSATLTVQENSAPSSAVETTMLLSAPERPKSLPIPETSAQETIPLAATVETTATVPVQDYSLPVSALETPESLPIPEISAQETTALAPTVETTATVPVQDYSLPVSALETPAPLPHQETPAPLPPQETPLPLPVQETSRPLTVLESSGSYCSQKSPQETVSAAESDMIPETLVSSSDHRKNDKLSPESPSEQLAPDTFHKKESSHPQSEEGEFSRTLAVDGMDIEPNNCSDVTEKSLLTNALDRDFVPVVETVQDSGDKHSGIFSTGKRNPETFKDDTDELKIETPVVSITDHAEQTSSVTGVMQESPSLSTDTLGSQTPNLSPIVDSSCFHEAEPTKLSPPRLCVQQQSVDDINRTELSRGIERMTVPDSQEEGQESPYPPPPDLSVERSPHADFSEKLGQQPSPVPPPQLVSQDVDQPLQQSSGQSVLPSKLSPSQLDGSHDEPITLAFKENSENSKPTIAASSDFDSTTRSGEVLFVNQEPLSVSISESSQDATQQAVNLLAGSSCSATEKNLESPRSPSSVKSSDSGIPIKSPSSVKSCDSGNDSPRAGRSSSSSKPQSSLPGRRETRASSTKSSHEQEKMVTRRQSQSSGQSATPAVRETRRSQPPTPPVRETRSRREKSPPAKRPRR